MEGGQYCSRKWRCWSPHCTPSLINPHLQNANSQHSARSYLLDANLKPFNSLLPSNELLRFCVPMAALGNTALLWLQHNVDVCSAQSTKVSCAGLERSQHDLWCIVTAPSRRDSLAPEPITASPRQCEPNAANTAAAPWDKPLWYSLLRKLASYSRPAQGEGSADWAFRSWDAPTTIFPRSAVRIP